MKNTRSIFIGRDEAMASDLSVVVRAALTRALTQEGRAAAQPPLRVESAVNAIAPRQMAAARSGDAAMRERLVEQYETCLRTYRGIARTMGGALGVDDLGAAMAFFVAVSLRALHGVDADASAMEQLQRQLHSVTRLAAGWDSATLAQRQVFFERIAIVSIMIACSLGDPAGQAPASVADVRRRAREYLQHLLGLDPDLVTLEANGLALRASASIGTEAAATATHH
jgi:hypothetical protein